MKKFLLNNKIQILLIIAINIFVWFKILLQIPLGEGYYYFDQCQSFLNKPGCSTTLWQYDNLARLIFDIIIPIFRDHLSIYMVFQFFTMIILYIIFYFTILKISKSKTFAFLATIFFSTNYVGSFSMMATGNYQRFVQRVPNLILLFISFWYLTKYYHNNKFKELIISYTLFAVSIFLSHHSIFLVPIFLIYPFTEIFLKKLKVKKLIKIAATSLVFFLLAIIIISKDFHKPSTSLFSFLSSTPNVAKMIFYQIPVLLIPNDFIIFLAKNWPKQPILAPYTPIVGFSLIIISIVFILTIIKIRKLPNQLTKLYLTCVLALPCISLLNTYSYDVGGNNPINNFGEDRTYFILSITSAIVWTTWVKLLAPKNKFKTGSIIVATLFILYNTNLIWKNINKIQYKSEAMKRFIQYSKSLSSNYTENSVIVAPSPVLWPQSFIKLFYGNQLMTFVSFDEGWKERVEPYGKNNVFILDYDYEKDTNPSIDYDPKKGKIIDLTENFRLGKKIDPLKF